MSLDEYPSVIPMPSNAMSSSSKGVSASSARRRKGGEGSARKKKGGTDSKFTKTGSSDKSGSSTHYAGARNLIFMVGGMSYTELGICRDIMEKESREIIMGSTRFVNPSEFIDDLATLV